MTPPTQAGHGAARPDARHRLPRRERIRRRPDFLAVQRRGIRTRGRYVTLIGLPNAHAVSRLGIVAPRRLGTAVQRNRSKRRVRELFRLQKPAGHLDLVVLPVREFLDAPLGALRDDFRRTLRRQVRAHRVP